MNPAQQLQQLFEQHKGPVIGVAVAGVAGAALLHRRKAGEASTTSGTPANPNPAAAVVPGNGGGYDSSAYDVYNAMQSQLGPVLDQLKQQNDRNTGGAPGSGVGVAPKPVASTLFAPSMSGKYVRGANGLIAEIESDGSLFGLTAGQWADVNKQTPKRSITSVGKLPSAIFSLAGNLRAANPAPAKAAAAPAVAPAPTA